MQGLPLFEAHKRLLTWMLQRDALKRPHAAELLTKNVFFLADDTVQRRRVEVAAFFANPRNDLSLYREIIELLGALCLTVLVTTITKAMTTMIR